MAKNPKKAKKTFCIISDNDGHNYICQSDKVEEAKEYFQFVESDMADDKFEEEPEWLIYVNGPVSKVHFTHFSIEEKENKSY
ncbi:MAG TPA: hypothetical protein DC057_02325 [Spirochaetia bacterium]|nr:hypothetical protein [Spirochaetia bacterium]